MDEVTVTNLFKTTGFDIFDETEIRKLAKIAEGYCSEGGSLRDRVKILYLNTLESENVRKRLNNLVGFELNEEDFVNSLCLHGLSAYVYEKLLSKKDITYGDARGILKDVYENKGDGGMLCLVEDLPDSVLSNFMESSLPFLHVIWGDFWKGVDLVGIINNDKRK